MNKFSFIELAILRMLSTAPLHGYAMSVKMQDYSEGNLNLPAGSLYPALHKLEKSQLITSSLEQSSGRIRRLYSLTPTGERVLTNEIASWRIIVKTMNAILGAA
jgi:PadR family transcriptional regulator PadR